jgi:hypothetical protein
MASTLPAVPERELPWLSNPLSCNPLFDDNQVSRPACRVVGGQPRELQHWLRVSSGLRLWLYALVRKTWTWVEPTRTSANLAVPPALCSAVPQSN